jgi:energy-coupling factor transporter ATP-binding protein EcfA2
MDIRIANCNNITSGNILITEGRLNIKYAINGTGKSTIAKAIESSVNHDEAKLKELTPYAFIGDNNPDHQPSVTGLPTDTNIAVFDERYVDQYVFLEDEDELLKNSFDIFVKTENYEQHLAEINRMVASVRTIFEDNPDLDRLITDMGEFISVFGSSRTGIANNGALVKGMSSGNLIMNIPQGLEDYSEFLTDAQNSKWLKWQATGHDFMALGDKCPFCTGNLDPHREKIERIKTEYDAKIIEHLSKILGLFERLGYYFDDETNAAVRDITASVQGLSLEQKTYLVGIKEQVETLNSKFQELKRLGFDSLKDIDRVADVLPRYKIDMRFLTHLNTQYTLDKVAIINGTVDQLIAEVGRLQGAVNQQKREIESTVRKYNEQINDFLRNAGYSYTVSIEEAQDHSYKLKLKFGDGTTSVSGVKSRLSFGERNAFALVLFMYHALYKKANLIILDDPISSFDKNKKFAILDMLFIRGGSLRGKTTLLLTHDFEPVIDTTYSHSNFFEGVPQAAFLENNNTGELVERPIVKEDIISSVQVADTNIQNVHHDICKLIYLRRRTEIVEGKTNAWHLLSNLFHKRQIPMIGSDERQMTSEEIEDSCAYIQRYVDNFDYNMLYNKVCNQAEMKDLYRSVMSNYEKLQIYRLIFDPTDETHVIRKFLNETYHIENDYLFQLNPIEFNTIPNFIIQECDSAIYALEA